MLSLLTLALLSADPAPPPMVVVVPVQVIHPDKKYAPLARAVQSLLEADLRTNGVPVRTEDDLDSKNWGSIKGATHVLAGSVIPMPDGQVMVQARLLALPDHILGSTRIRGWNERQMLVRVTTEKLGLALPTVTPRLMSIDEELMLAWGAALDALHDGAPDAAKKRIVAVAAKWPSFTPAVERAAQLGK